MTNNQLNIEYDVAKRKKIILLPIALIAFSAVMLYLILTADRLKIFYLAMFAMILLGSIYGIFILVKSIYSKDQIGLSINEDTVKFNGTPSGKAAGAIKWTDIESISTSIQYSTEQIYMKLKTPGKYIFQRSKIEMANYGLFINSTELKISPAELEKLLRDYLEKYGNNSTQ